MSDLSGLNPTPHAIAVYASRPLSPGLTQHSLPSRHCPLLGPVFHRLDRTSLPGALIRSPRRDSEQRWMYLWAERPGRTARDVETRRIVSGESELGENETSWSANAAGISRTRWICVNHFRLHA